MDLYGAEFLSTHTVQRKRYISIPCASNVCARPLFEEMISYNDCIFYYLIT